MIKYIVVLSYILLSLLVVFSSCSSEKNVIAFDLNLEAKNKTDLHGNKQGLWEEETKVNTHFHYHCLDAEYDAEIIKEKGLVLVKGYYKDNQRIGVWKKYMPKLDSSYTEYFFYKNGECFKHQYFEHHIGEMYTDSLNLTRDTVITFYSNNPSIACNYHSNGKKGTFNILTMSYLYPRLHSKNRYEIHNGESRKDTYIELRDSITLSTISVFREYIYSDSIWKRYINFQTSSGYIVTESKRSGRKDSTLILYENGVIRELK
jgi:hypothetical protein